MDWLDEDLGLDAERAPPSGDRTTNGTGRARKSKSSSKPSGSAPPSGWPFRLADNGVEKRIERTDKDSGDTAVEWKWFCSRIEVAAETRSEAGEEWGRLLTVTDRDQRIKEWAMPMAMMAGDGAAYRERLLSLGMVMAPGKFARDALHEFIATARPDHKARCVPRIGWQGRTFVRFNGNIGD